MAKKNPILEQMLEEGPVYVDNCRMDEVLASDLTEEQRASVVVTPEVREEYLNSDQGRENLRVLDNFSSTNVHKLAYRVQDSSNYGVANQLFKSIALKNLMRDFSNKAYEEAFWIYNPARKLKTASMDNLIKFGLLCIGALGLVHLERSEGDGKISRAYNKVYDAVNFWSTRHRNRILRSKRRLIENPSFEFLAGKSNKKSRRRMKKQDLSKVVKNFWDKKGHYTPDKVQVYHDVDIAVQAVLDSYTNNRDITVYTADKEFVTSFAPALREMFASEKPVTNLKIHYTNGEKTQVEEVGIPGCRQKIRNCVDNYIKANGPVNPDPLLKHLNTMYRYHPIYPGRTLSNAVNNGLSGVLSGVYTAAFGKFALYAAQNPEQVKNLVETVREENLVFPALAATVGAVSMAAITPRRCYTGIKNSINSFKQYINEWRMLK